MLWSVVCVNSEVPSGVLFKRKIVSKSTNVFDSTLRYIVLDRIMVDLLKSSREIIAI